MFGYKVVVHLLVLVVALKSRLLDVFDLDARIGLYGVWHPCCLDHCSCPVLFNWALYVAKEWPESLTLLEFMAGTANLTRAFQTIDRATLAYEIRRDWVCLRWLCCMYCLLLVLSVYCSSVSHMFTGLLRK